ncbi:MAG: FAD:protein FMN transferase [Myxococcales bacterium]|nr:FAD:protein FMN transferase [Myxococcales bacterium]
MARRRRWATLVGICALVSLEAHGGPRRDGPVAPLVEVRDSGRELGTPYDVVIVTSTKDEARARAALRELRVFVRGLERRFSEWMPDSEISRINRDAGRGWVAIAPDMAKLLRGALHVSRVTDGAFDVSWAPLGALYDRARRNGRLPGPAAIRRYLQRVGWRGVRLEKQRIRFARRGMKLGIAGVAKGWIIDALFGKLAGQRFRNVIINIGGDLRTSGRDRWGREPRFVIADPYRKGRFVASLTISNVAIATSGNYLRYRMIGGRRVGHIVDPRSGRTPLFDGSVTVLTRDAAMADALATALYVMGPARGLAFAKRIRGLDVIFVTRQGVQTSLKPGRLR